MRKLCRYNGCDKEVRINKESRCRMCINRRYVDRNFVIVADFCVRSGCSACGEFDLPMRAEHRLDKEKFHGMSIYAQCNAGVGVKKLNEELAKCDVFCSDCRTIGAGGFDKSKDAFVYVVTNSRFAKVGIANIGSDRLEQHQRQGLEVHRTWNMSGVDAARIESEIKATYCNGGFVSKKDLPDGYTETFDIALLDDVVAAI